MSNLNKAGQFIIFLILLFTINNVCARNAFFSIKNNKLIIPAVSMPILKDNSLYRVVLTFFEENGKDYFLISRANRLKNQQRELNANYSTINNILTIPLVEVRNNNGKIEHFKLVLELDPYNNDIFMVTESINLSDEPSNPNNGTNDIPDNVPNNSSFDNTKIGIISAGSKGRPMYQDIIDHPLISGFIVLEAWKNIEYEDGQYDWSFLDSEVARAKAAGKIVRFAIHTGGEDIPNWVMNNYSEIKKIFVFNKEGKKIWIPAYWDNVFLTQKIKFYRAMGNRYKDEPTVFAIGVSMVDPKTGDWAFPIEDEEQIKSFLDAGFSEKSFSDAYKRLIDAGMIAYENKYVTTAVGTIDKKLVGNGNEYNAVHQTLDYAYETYSNRLIIMKGSLHAKIADIDDSKKFAWETMDRYKNYPTAAQMVWSVTNDPDFRMNGHERYSKSEIPNIFKQAFEKGSQYELNWVEPYTLDILNPDLQNELEYAVSLILAK